MTPMIGITTYHASADWRGWSEEGALLPWKYVTSIRDNGGSTVLLPPNGDAADAPAEAENIVSRLDGVVIAGGSDIDPATYGAAPRPTATSGNSRSPKRRSSSAFRCSASAAACRCSMSPPAGRCTSTSPTSWVTTITA